MDSIKYNLPKTQEGYDERFSGRISNEQKAVLTEEQLKNLNENGMLEGDFVYENGKPIKFLDISEVEFREETAFGILEQYKDILLQISDDDINK